MFKTSMVMNTQSQDSEVEEGAEEFKVILHSKSEASPGYIRLYFKYIYLSYDIYIIICCMFLYIYMIQG